MDDARELIRGNTPTMVLAVLQGSARHGYAIAREVNRRTGHSLKFKQGTLYPVLYALERDALITGTWEHPDGERPRKVYTITAAGQAELERRLKVWRAFAAAMDRVVEGTPHEQPA
jgi:PadR family transcriptional regulator, regulatory protein PadR